MKRFKGLLVFVLVFISVFFLNNTKSFAEEAQYTENLIPTMSSNTSPSGKANASSVYASIFPAWKAFDKDVSTSLNGWVTANGSVTGWLEYDFTEAKSISKYTIVSRSYSASIVSELPKDWTFEAYDETLGQWVILDKQTNVTDWVYKLKKEFTFSNTNYYKNYRINITDNCGYGYTSIGELEMIESVIPQVSAPANLVATAEDSNIQLSWNSATNAQYYNIKRSITPGGPYETIATSSAITYNDTDVTPDITYYYVVSAVVSNVESQDSNEASATIEVAPIDNILKVVLEVGEELQLSVDDDLAENTNMTWTSSDNTVATVDGDGVVTALKPGNTVVTVVSKDGTYTDKINVLVVENADDYRLAVDLKVGKSCRLTIDDLTDTVNVTWDSSDESVATVSTKGKVTAVSEGLTLITATDEEGNIIGQVYVRVRE